MIFRVGYKVRTEEELFKVDFWDIICSNGFVVDNFFMQDTLNVIVCQLLIEIHDRRPFDLFKSKDIDGHTFEGRRLSSSSSFVCIVLALKVENVLNYYKTSLRMSSSDSLIRSFMSRSFIFRLVSESAFFLLSCWLCNLLFLDNDCMLTSLCL